MKKGVTAYLIQCKEQKRLDAKTLKAYPASFLFCFIRYYYIKLYVSVELLI